MANFDLSKLMEGKNPQSVMLNETRQLKGKWERTGLLEGLKAKDQSAMAVLLETKQSNCLMRQHKLVLVQILKSGVE